MQLYERSQRQLRAVAARYVGDEAEDVVQDAFLRALRSGDAFRGDSTPLTWLHRIVVNASIDRCRKRHRREQFSQEHRPRIVRAAVEDSLAVRSALRRLTWDQRRVFVMYDVLGHTHNEIAGLLAIAPGTSKRRLANARKRLQKALR